MLDLDQSIRERAYHLWIAAGRPEGDSDAYWLEAQREHARQSGEQRGEKAHAKDRVAPDPGAEMLEKGDAQRLAVI